MSDRDKILVLPHAHHPRLARAVEYLATRPGMTTDFARRVLEEFCVELGITKLDIEMAHPASVSTVPFAPARHDAGGDYQEQVRAHLHAHIHKGQQ